MAPKSRSPRTTRPRPTKGRATKPRASGAARAPRKRAGGTGTPGMVEAALAAFAHEVRTPLTGILAISDLLATSDLGERERRWVDTIKAGAEHLASLATLFVDAARGGNAGVRQDLFDLRALARNAGDSLAGRAAAKGLQSRVDISEKLAGARGRRSRPAARGAGKPDRQCGEVHRSGRRRAVGRADARRASQGARSVSPLRFPTAASGSRSTRSSACSARSRRPMSASPRASAAPGSDCRR